MSTGVSLEKSGNIEPEIKKSLNERQVQYQIMSSSLNNKKEDVKNEKKLKQKEE